MTPQLNHFLPIRGLLAETMKDYVYHVPRCGHIYTTPGMAANLSLRFYAVVTLTARGAPFKLRVDGQVKCYEAVALKPLVDRGVFADTVQLISFQIDARDPRFRYFRAIPAPGVLALDRHAFIPFEESLDAAYRGQLDLADAKCLFDDVLKTALRDLPTPLPLDSRVKRVIELLRKRWTISLEELASEVGLSYDRLSHLFADSMGLPLRSYQLWQKLHCAMGLLPSGLSVTETAHTAGFTDSAHLSRTFQQVYGASPSYFLNSNKVRVFAEKSSSPYMANLDFA